MITQPVISIPQSTNNLETSNETLLEVENVARKKFSDSGTEYEDRDGVCSCAGTLIVPQISKARITASLCECAPKRREKPSLSEKASQRFFIWERQNAEATAATQMEARFDTQRIGLSRTRSQIHAPTFTEDEVAAFQAYQREKQEVEAHNAHVMKVCQVAERKIEAINSASFPCRMLPPRRADLPRTVQLWLKSLGIQAPESLFLHGTPGTGKTTLAVWAAYYAILDGHVADACFLTSDLIMSFKKDANVAGFNSRDSDACRQKWTSLKSYLEKASLIIIDDLGSQKNSESVEAAYSEVIGLRYTSGLPAIFTSNHGAKDGLDRRTLADQIGPRAADRVLGSRTYAMTGPSKRGVKCEPEDEPLEQQCDVVDMELVRNFQTSGIEEGETTSPFFVAQNPIFNLVSDKERARLTDEEGRDIALPERRASGWQEGSEVSMIGYLLCQNDLLIFLSVFELLHDFHRNGGKGVSFVTTISEIRRKLGLKSDAKNVTDRILRSLIRLAKTRIEYRWGREFFIGGFIDDVYHKTAKSQSRLMISINPRFVSFYERASFFKINTAIPTNLSYHARLLYVFLESQPADVVSIPFPKLAMLYGKSETAAKNRKFRESVRESLKELKSYGLQGEEAQVLTNGIITTRRIPRISQPLSLPC